MPKYHFLFQLSVYIRPKIRKNQICPSTVYANCYDINEMNLANNISFKIGRIIRRNGNLAESEDGQLQSSFVN